MNFTKSRFFFPVSALMIWVILIVWFGFFSHFSLAGLGLWMYALCLLAYDSMQISAAQTSNKQLLAAVIGLIFSGISVVNAFFLEGQGWFFKGFVAFFSLAVGYVFVHMIRETWKKRAA